MPRRVDIIQDQPAMGMALALLFILDGAGVSTFSFSGISIGTGISCILRPDADSLIRPCSNAVLDALLCIPGVPGAAAGLADEDLASEDASLVLDGVGVPREARLAFGGGGPIEPVITLDGEVVPFPRTLLPKAFVAGVSSPRMLSLFVSERADGGRIAPGVPNIDESRR